MVSKDVRVLIIVIKKKAAKTKNGTFARSMVSRASLRSLSRLSTFVSEAPATPPPPNLEPTRF